MERIILLQCSDWVPSREDVMRTAANVAESNGIKFPDEIPTQSWMRSFRLRHPELFDRVIRSKEIVRADAEHLDHIRTYKTAFKNDKTGYHGIFNGSSRFFNREKVKVQTGVGKKKKVLGATGRDRGGRHGKQGTDKNVTTVLTTNAAGDIIPIQFIVEGRLQLKRWYDPLPQSVAKNSTKL